MKIIITKIILSLLLVFCLLCIFPVVNSESNLIQYGVPYATRPYIVFPSNLTYKSEVSSLNVSFHAEIWGNYNYSMTYSLDGQEKTALPLTQHYFGMFNQAESYIDGSVTLPTLSNGVHNVRVFLTLTKETWDKMGSRIHTYLDAQTVYFTTQTEVLQNPSPTHIIAVAPTPHRTYRKGDPYTTVYSPSEITPPNGTKLPIITITSMVNNSVITSNNLTLTFNLTIESPTAYYPITLQGLCYKPSWQPDNTTIDFGSNSKFVNKTIPFSISFTNITDGAKSVTIYASTLCEFETGREIVSAPISPSSSMIGLYGKYLYVYSNYYFTEGSSSVNFTIDTSPTPTPSIPEFSSWATPLLLGLMVAAAGLLVYRKKRKVFADNLK